MNDQQTCVTGCGRPTGDMLCRRCLSELLDALRELVTDGNGGRGLIAELSLTHARQHNMTTSPGIGTPSATQPLPYHEAASQVGLALANTVTTWARSVHEYNPHLLPPAGSTAAAAAWMAGLPNVLALHPAADELHADMLTLVARVRRVIDRPPDRIYAGPCEQATGDGLCPTQLYARPGARTVRCWRCRSEHDVADRREWMIRYAADLRVTATIALGWCRLLLDHDIPQGTWRSWVSRGRITAHGTDRRGRPVYRFGDVRDLALRHVARAA